MSNRTPAYQASVAVMELLEDAGDFEGTATELLNLLEFSAPEAAQKMRSWPKSPRALSNRLRRAATYGGCKDANEAWAKLGRLESCCGYRELFTPIKKARSVENDALGGSRTRAAGARGQEPYGHAQNGPQRHRARVGGCFAAICLWLSATGANHSEPNRRQKSAGASCVFPESDTGGTLPQVSTQGR